MHFGDASPEAIEFGAQKIGFVNEDDGARQQIEDGVAGAGHGRIKFPSGKNCDSARAYCGFNDFFGTLNSFS